MKKIILDLDTGIDDTLAIVYTLAAPDAELIGITGAFGNVSMDLGVKNALGILAIPKLGLRPVSDDRPETGRLFRGWRTGVWGFPLRCGRGSDRGRGSGPGGCGLLVGPRGTVGRGVLGVG